MSGVAGGLTNSLVVTHTNVYVVGANGDAIDMELCNKIGPAHCPGVAVFARNPSTGAVSFSSAWRDESLAPVGYGGVDFSSDGKTLFVLTSGGLNGAIPASLLVFDIDAGTGALSYKTRHSEHCVTVPVTDIVAYGESVYVTAQGSVRDPRNGTLAQYDYESATGSIEFRSCINDDLVTNPVAIAVSADGTSTYVASPTYGIFISRLVIYDRQASHETPGGKGGGGVKMSLPMLLGLVSACVVVLLFAGIFFAKQMARHNRMKTHAIRHSFSSTQHAANNPLAGSLP